MRRMCALLLLVAFGCGAKPRPLVVVYTSVDAPFAEPILREFTEKTGIEVRPLYDTEAAKTVGLARRLLAEKAAPRCDVFWSNEILQTVMLGRAGLFTPYASPETTAALRGPGDLFAYLGGRLRVILARAEAVGASPRPESILALSDAAQRGRGAMAQPLAGTTLTHAVALFLIMGEDKAAAFFDAVIANGTKAVAGNATAKDLVVEGEAAFCLTDSDDAEKGLKENPALALIVPDQAPGGLGALMIPGSIALCANAPHAQEATRLIDFLLARETIARLRREGAFQLPLRDDIADTPEKYRLERIRLMAVDWDNAYALLARAQERLMQLFLK